MIAVMDVMEAMAKQKHGKSLGPDSIHMEAFTHGVTDLTCI